MRDDVPLLASEVLQRLTGPQVVPPKLSFAALRALQSYSFPGNVRELENILERALALTSSDEIRVEDLQLGERQTASVISSQDLAGLRASLPLPEYLERIEKEAIIEALKKTRYNRTNAAKLLGITVRALRYRMEKLDVEEQLDKAVNGENH
jgi:two-component system response regulator PilR (NtrC family)